MAAQRARERIQARLQQLAADGHYGPATEAAVMAFQQQNDLAVDGIAGPDTLAALQRATGLSAHRPVGGFA